MEEICIKIEGMTCGGCVRNVHQVLQALDGVDEVSVSLERGEAQVRCDTSRVTVAQLRDAVEDAGFDAPA